MMYFVKQNIYCLSNVVYCFMQWIVYQLCFCRKVNRLYKYNDTHTQRKTIRRNLTESSNLITRNATITDVVTDGFTDTHTHTNGLTSIGISQRVRKLLHEMPQSPTTSPTLLRSLVICQWSNFTDKITNGMCEFQRVCIE